MASLINADNGIASGSVGLKYSSDNSGVLALQSNNNTIISASNTLTTISSTNVGIGTNNPEMRVDVNGGVRVQSITNPSSGSGMELAYDGTQGIIQAYSNRATLASVPVYLVTGQLRFPPTQNPSADANTLDDYEEGTWTPIGNGITFATAIGHYTKIGNTVTIWWDVTWPTTSNTNAASIMNLPFTPPGNIWSGSMAITNVTFSDMLVFVHAGQNNIFHRNHSNNDYSNAQFSQRFAYGSATYKVI